MKKIPAAKDDAAYYKAYTEACAFWMLKILSEIEKVMDKDELYDSGPVPENSLWKPKENSGRSRALSRLQAFIEVSQKHGDFPYLQSMAQSILQELKARWADEKPLDLEAVVMEVMFFPLSSSRNLEILPKRKLRARIP